ncbi:MAG: HAD-IIIA family hydrolase [Thermoplasmata archaeon]
MGRLKAVLFDLGDTLIREIEGPADIHTTEFEVLDGVYDVLGYLDKKYKLAIVSNTLTWDDDAVAQALERKDLLRYFDTIVTSVGANSRKPDDEIFKKALRRLQVLPHQAVMIGDRVDADIVGANRVGITSILYRWNTRYPANFSGDESLPDYVIGSMRELPMLLDWLDED